MCATCLRSGGKELDAYFVIIADLAMSYGSRGGGGYVVVFFMTITSIRSKSKTGSWREPGIIRRLPPRVAPSHAQLNRGPTDKQFRPASMGLSLPRSWNANERMDPMRRWSPKICPMQAKERHLYIAIYPPPRPPSPNSQIV